MVTLQDFLDKKKLIKDRRSRKQSDIIYRNYVNFDGIPLSILNREDWGSYVPALRSIHQQLKNMLTHHCKVFCLRMDFHISPEHWSEGQYSTYLKASISKIKIEYKLIRVAYVWGREQSQDGKHHYHLMIAVDGNKVQYPLETTNILTNEWTKLGHPHPRRNNHHMIKNTFDDDFKDAYQHFSYIAKIHSKDEQPRKARNFGYSRINSASNQTKFSQSNTRGVK